MEHFSSILQRCASPRALFAGLALSFMPISAAGQDGFDRDVLERCLAMSFSLNVADTLAACETARQADLAPRTAQRVDLTRASLLLSLNDRDAAIHATQQALDHDSQSAMAWIVLARLEAPHDPAASDEAYSQALAVSEADQIEAIHFDRHITLMAAAGELAAQDQMEQAIAALSLPGVDPDPVRQHQVLAYRGQLKARRGDRAGALADWETAILRANDQPAAFLARGLFAAQEGRVDEALEDLHMAYQNLGNQPGFQMPLALYERLLQQAGIAQLQGNDLFGAARTYRQALEISPGGRAETAVGFFIQKAEAVVRDGAPHEAEQLISTGRSFVQELREPLATLEFELQLAGLNLRLGRLEGASAQLGQALVLLDEEREAEHSATRKKTLAELSVHAGLALSRLGEEDEGRRRLAQAAALVAGTPYEGEIAESAGDVLRTLSGAAARQEAASAYANALQLTAQSEDKLRLALKQAQARKDAGDLTGARENLAETLGRHPHVAEAWLMRAEIDRLLEDKDEALEAYDSALQVATSPATRAKAHLGRGEVHLALGALQTAEQDFQRAVELAPRYALAWEALGTLQIQAGQPLNALQAFDRVIEIAPDTPAVRLARAQLLQNSGRHADAISDLDVYLNRKTEPDADQAYAHFLRGVSRFASGDASAAGQDIERAVAVRPDDPLVRLWSGRVAVRLGEVDMAIEAFDESLPALDEEVVKTYQQTLSALGLYAGTADGVYGPATRKALRACAEIRCL